MFKCSDKQLLNWADHAPANWLTAANGVEEEYAPRQSAAHLARYDFCGLAARGSEREKDNNNNASERRKRRGKRRGKPGQSQKKTKCQNLEKQTPPSIFFPLSLSLSFPLSLSLSLSLSVSCEILCETCLHARTHARVTWAGGKEKRGKETSRKIIPNSSSELNLLLSKACYFRAGWAKKG